MTVQPVWWRGWHCGGPGDSPLPGPTSQQLFVLDGYFPPSLLKRSLVVSILYSLFLSSCDFFHKLINNTIITVQMLTFLELTTCSCQVSSFTGIVLVA